MKTAVIVCSNAGLDYIDHEYNIPIFRSVINLGEKSYNDFVDLTADEFYHILATDKSAFPKTAFVSIAKMIETFELLKKQGYNRAFVITISKELSSLNTSVSLAAEDVKDFEVVTYDSKTISYPEALMALEAAKMFNEDKSLEEVVKVLDNIRDNQEVFFSVDTLEYLIKNGRLSKVKGAFANIAKVKPILKLDENGKVENVENIRTSVKSRARLVEIFLERIQDKKVIVYIAHANADKEVIEEIRNAIKAARPDLTDIKAYLLTPVVGAHCGPKAIGLGYIKIK